MMLKQLAHADAFPRSTYVIHLKPPVPGRVCDNPIVKRLIEILEPIHQGQKISLSMLLDILDREFPHNDFKNRGVNAVLVLLGSDIYPRHPDFRNRVSQLNSSHVAFVNDGFSHLPLAEPPQRNAPRLHAIKPPAEKTFTFDRNYGAPVVIRSQVPATENVSMATICDRVAVIKRLANRISKTELGELLEYEFPYNPMGAQIIKKLHSGARPEDFGSKGGRPRLHSTKAKPIEPSPKPVPEPSNASEPLAESNQHPRQVVSNTVLATRFLELMGSNKRHPFTREEAFMMLEMEFPNVTFDRTKKGQIDLLTI